MKRQFFTAVIMAFLALEVAFRFLHNYDAGYKIAALECGNVLMLVLSFIGYKLVTRKIEGRPHAFVQGVFSATFLRLMICMVAMLAYIFINRTNIHKPTVFVLFGIYAVYSAVETIILSRIAKK